MSRPTTMTFLPSRAREMATLEATNVLPSPEIEEVNIRTFSSFFSINWMLVRNPRKISSIRLLTFWWTTISALPLETSLATGMSAITGIWVSLTTSAWPSILYLKNSIRKRIPAGMAKPNTNAISRMMAALGLVFPTSDGASMILPLSAVAAREIEFSSRFCKSIR